MSNINTRSKDAVSKGKYSAEAWYTAGRTYVEMKQPDEAAKLWQRVIKDHPSTQWARLAKQRLDELKKAP